mgnify:CR=1 FL=1
METPRREASCPETSGDVKRELIENLDSNRTSQRVCCVNPLENKNYLDDLSLRLVRLSGNERIRKRVRGAGGGDAFNVLDEVPQLALEHLLDGKKFELVPFPDVEEFLKDEKTKAFEDAFNELREREGREFDSLDDARAWADANPYIEAGVYERVTVKPFKAVLP